jgi:hypothetical protein
MSKVWYPPGGAPFPVQTNATTVGPQVVRTITASPKLASLAHCGVYEDGGDTLRIYRASGEDPGTLSCEVYRRQGSGWSRPKKERRKYAPPDALFPVGAKVETIDGVPCGSLADFTPEQRETLRHLLAERPG